MLRGGAGYKATASKLCTWAVSCVICGRRGTLLSMWLKRARREEEIAPGSSL